MKTISAILALSLVAVASGGIVEPIFRCGGVGTFRQLRVSDCTGYCIFYPGRVYNCELDFSPSGFASSLTLKVEVCLNGGFCLQILQTVLPNSSVQPGFVYTAKYDLVPNDQLAGQTFDFRGYISHTETDLLDICVSAGAEVEQPVIPTTTPTTTGPTTTTTTTTTTTPTTTTPTTTTPAPTTTSTLTK